jgi:hypothetical protein
LLQVRFYTLRTFILLVPKRCPNGAQLFWRRYDGRCFAGQ